MTRDGEPTSPKQEGTTSRSAIRADLDRALAHAWSRTGESGTWWSGEQRVAIADETRRARQCPLCAGRKQALSPYSVEGKHAAGDELPPVLIDMVHRITTDPGRLSRRLFDEAVAAGIDRGAYIEALATVVRTINVDAFTRTLDLPQRSLPQPVSGEPTRRSPDGAVDGEAWVPMLPLSHAFFGGKQVPNVVRALSVVPEELLALVDLVSVEYLGPRQVADATYDPGRALSRAQMELIAGRVSALNQCFY